MLIYILDLDTMVSWSQLALLSETVGRNEECGYHSTPQAHRSHSSEQKKERLKTYHIGLDVEGSKVPDDVVSVLAFLLGWVRIIKANYELALVSLGIILI